MGGGGRKGVGIDGSHRGGAFRGIEKEQHMAAVTAQAVKDLREKTDLPMMECKQALTECGGDMGAAIEWLRKKYKGKMTEREGRATGEGRIGVFVDPSGTSGALIDLQCETAPVAHNEMFVKLANNIAKVVAMGSVASPNPEDIRKMPAVDAEFTEVFGRLRETMNLGKCRRMTGGSIWSYVHHDGKSGVMVALDAVPKSDKRIGPDLCMHTLFCNPISIDRHSVPAAEVEKVRNQAIEIAQGEGKPEQIVSKIADGKVNAFYAEKVLMEQFHVKTDDYGKNAKIADVLKAAGVSKVTDMVIMKVGM
jgi:elongation factor Ts